MLLPDDKRFDITPVLDWWKAMHPDASGVGGNKALRAALRRSDDPFDAVMQEGVHQLIRASRASGLFAKDERLVLAAIVLSRIEPDQNYGGSLFQTWLGVMNPVETSASGRPMLAEIRFQNLLRAMMSEDMASAAKQMCQTVRLIGRHNFDVAQLVSDILWFTDRAATRWTYGYWGTPSVANTFFNTQSAF